jgi:hypothetical protein
MLDCTLFQLLTWKPLKELIHLCEIGVSVQPQLATKWSSPTFITPQNDGRIHWVTDLWELDKVVRCQQYPLPIIQDILRKHTGYEFFTKIDISMQYCTFENEDSKELCTISTPFGKIKYNRLPMGLKCSPDFAQEVTGNIFGDVTEVEVYIDDIGIFSDSLEQHLAVLFIVLQKPKENGFTVNSLKCECAVKETDWLDYWLTPTG